MKKPVKIALIVLCVIFLSIFVYSGYKLISTLHEYKVAEDTYNKISSDYVSPKSDKNKDKDNSDGNQITESSPVDVDFDALLNQCQDVVGWLYSENTVINYPVVQAEDNFYYLHRFIDGQYNASGSLFLDCTCYGDFSGKNTVLYGHNMNNGTMFNNVTKFLDEDFFNSTNITIYTLDGIYTYEPFAIFETISTFQYFRMRFQDDADFVSFCEKMQEQSLYNKNMKFTGSDHIITLSTCTNSFTSTGRYALHAKLIKVEK